MKELNRPKNNRHKGLSYNQGSPVFRKKDRTVIKIVGLDTTNLSTHFYSFLVNLLSFTSDE